MVHAEGELKVVSPDGLKVLVVCSTVEQVSWSGEVAVKAVGVLAGKAKKGPQ